METVYQAGVVMGGTGHPILMLQAFDRAVTDRVDEVVELDLPQVAALCEPCMLTPSGPRACPAAGALHQAVHCMHCCYDAIVVYVYMYLIPYL